MKKLFNLALVGTMVLAAIACQREQVGSSSEANENGVNEVTTQFVLNVASAPQTKMSADVVQQNKNFRGIQDARLFAYKTNTTSGTPYVLNTGTPADGNVKEFNLGILMAANSLDNSGSNNKTESSERILNLSVPVGVDAILFYGKAIKGSGNSNMEYGVTHDYNYTLTSKPSTLLTTPASTEFYAHPMLDADNKVAYEQTGALMIAAINKLLATEIDGTPSAEFGEAGSTVTFTNLPPVSWAMYGHRYELDKASTPRYAENVSGVEMLDHSLKDLEEVVGQCYYLFTYIKSPNVPTNLTVGSDEWFTWIKEHKGGQLGEYRGGSSFSLLRQVGDMYKVLHAVETAIPTNAHEANAVLLARQIIIYAKQVFDLEGQTYQSKTSFTTFVGNSSSYTQVTDNMIKNYPAAFNIPEGAAQLGFNAQDGNTYQEDEFYYYHPENKPLVNPTMASFEPRKYIYPAELWYYTNSPIRVAEKDITWTAMNGTSNWSNDDKWSSDWKANAKVTSATRAIALRNNINYGVAMLKSVVTAETVLKDNRDAMTDEGSDRSITTATANITLNGILVGGQNPRMNWQFVRKYESGEFSYFDGVVYDNAVGTSNNISSTITNYTLLYDNFNSSQPESNQNDVYVALEFINGGSPFWGRDNLIPSGGKFYLVGKLPKPGTNAIVDSAWPTDHQIPPVYGLQYGDGSNYPATVSDDTQKGQSRKVARVFIQDFVTTANFNIGQDALKHAYYSVPDLRASQMSLGLSVDLQWTSGLTYNVEL